MIGEKNLSIFSITSNNDNLRCLINWSSPPLRIPLAYVLSGSAKFRQENNEEMSNCFRQNSIFGDSGIQSWESWDVNSSLRCDLFYPGHRNVSKKAHHSGEKSGMKNNFPSRKVSRIPEQAVDAHVLLIMIVKPWPQMSLTIAYNDRPVRYSWRQNVLRRRGRSPKR